MTSRSTGLPQQPQRVEQPAPCLTRGFHRVRINGPYASCIDCPTEGNREWMKAQNNIETKAFLKAAK